MPHSHAHSHNHAAGTSERRLFWAMWLIGAFLLVEFAGGLLANSLALLADAGHMLADTGSLALAWVAIRTARKPAGGKHSFGYHRLQVLAAFINGATLLMLSIWIIYEAVMRFLYPQTVLGPLMLATAAIGLVVNTAVFFVLNGGDRSNLNMRGAILHVLGDLFGFAAAIIAAVIIIFTSWMPVDPLLSIVVALLIIRSAFMLSRESSHILMEGTPAGLDLAEVRRQLTSDLPEVEDIHHLHAWSLTEAQSMLTLHANISPNAEHGPALARIRDYLTSRFGITHATVQIERGQCVGGVCACIEDQSKDAAKRSREISHPT